MTPDVPAGRPARDTAGSPLAGGDLIRIDGMSSYVACSRCGAYHDQREHCPRCGR